MTVMIVRIQQTITTSTWKGYFEQSQAREKSRKMF